MEIKNISRKIIKKGDAIIYTSLIGFLFVIINIFSVNFFKRLDLTVSKKFTLSLVTKRRLSSLDDIVTIRAYFSKQLPPRFAIIKQEVSDFLNDYQIYSRGKIKISYFDPLEDPKIEREALSYGVPQIQFSDIEKDKFQIQNGFLGLVVIYEDRYETLPVIENIENLEYELTTAILKVLNKKNKNIGFLVFPPKENEAQKTDDYQFLKKFLERQYQVQILNLKGKAKINSDIDTLIIVGDKDKAPEYQKFLIDQFVMSGKGVVFLVNGVTLNEGLSGISADHNLFDLLEWYGVKVNNDLVLDSYADIASFQTGYTTFLTPYPFWPKIQKTGFLKDNPITAKMETLTLHWPSSITVKKDNQKNAKYQILVKTSKKSWVTANIYNLSPQQNFSPQESEFKESPLVVLVTGNLTSYYKNKEIPKDEESITSLGKDNTLKSVKEAKILVISNANFLKDNFLSRSQESLVFFLNAVDYLNQETDLLSIRAKSLSDSPIPELTDNQRVIIKWGNVLAPLVLTVIVYGGYRLIEKKEDKKIIEVFKS